METEQCGNCRFYILSKGDSGKGFCRRYPPSFAVDGSIDSPIIALEYWCGEWKEAEKPPENYSKLFGCSRSSIVSRSGIECALTAHPGLHDAATDALKRLVASGVGVDELLEMTPDQFAGRHQCGPTSANEIVEWIAMHENNEVGTRTSVDV